MTAQGKALLRYCEVASRLQVSVASVRRLVASGSLRVVHVGARSPRIALNELERFIKQKEEDNERESDNNHTGRNAGSLPE